MAESISFSNLVITIDQLEEEVRYTFAGEVDENFSQEKVPRIKKPNIRLILGQVEQFNSVGIREWILFIADLKKYGALVFQECSVAVIDQINMVPDSLGNGTVESFFAPYYCECGKEVNKLIICANHMEDLSKLVAPRFECDCKKTLEFDALEESYFQFINAIDLSS